MNETENKLTQLITELKCYCSNPSPLDKDGYNGVPQRAFNLGPQDIFTTSGKLYKHINDVKKVIISPQSFFKILERILSTSNISYGFEITRDHTTKINQTEQCDLISICKDIQLE